MGLCEGCDHFFFDGEYIWGDFYCPDCAEDKNKEIEAEEAEDELIAVDLPDCPYSPGDA